MTKHAYDKIAAGLAEAEGYAAWGCGIQHDDCPHPEGRDRQAWQFGWREAEQRNRSAQFAPGSFGCHEALHMASVLMEMVDERLCEHPAIEAKPEWAALAERARMALFDLYQAIGKEHLG